MLQTRKNFNFTLGAFFLKKDQVFDLEFVRYCYSKYAI